MRSRKPRAEGVTGTFRSVKARGVQAKTVFRSTQPLGRSPRPQGKLVK